ncbi:unnamed protein product [Gongylonema pulchrum]|uniref:AraC family transcriptional regulator n=1 Tax=Gongylonema pulchrum TaxID=637853 RepID=A0A183DD98_9BILA|nr:unnamed protein product [Gongylonema pulchrum]
MRIFTESEIMHYVLSLLNQFGGQLTHADLPWRLFATLLPDNVQWPRNPVKLMDQVADLSPFLVFSGQTLRIASSAYLLANSTTLQ